eukprot:COSAG05_NODE_5481_length_1162_cov_1.317027_1_plen_326_part_10
MEADDEREEQDALQQLNAEFQQAGIAAGLGSTLGNLGNYEPMHSRLEDEDDDEDVHGHGQGEQLIIEADIANEVHLASSSDTARVERCTKLGLADPESRLQPPLNAGEDEEDAEEAELMRMDAAMAAELFGACPQSARADREPERPQTASAREVEQELERELDRLIGDSDSDEEGSSLGAKRAGAAGGEAQVMVLGDSDVTAGLGLDDSDVNTRMSSSGPAQQRLQQHGRRRRSRTGGSKSAAPTYEAAAYLEEQIANDITAADCPDDSVFVGRGAIDDLLASRRPGTGSSQRPSSASFDQRPMSAASEQDFVASLKQGHIADLVN